MSAMKVQQRIAIVGGCGHVGLPLGIAFAGVPGMQVDLVDTNAKSVEAVNAGHIHFVENGGEAHLKRVVGKSLVAHTDGKVLKNATAVVFVTGTPVDEHLNPRISDIIAVMDQYLPLLNDGQLVILRSTVYPGVTNLVREHLQRKKPGLKIAFCPERVAQGYAIEEIAKFPQIVSAFDPEAEEQASNLFSLIVPEILKMTPQEAELVKLFSNSWRYLEFAVANQHYMIAEANGADFQRIYQALTYHYPRAATFKRPGLTAGPCLFKDTMQLSAFYDNQFFLGHAAMLINEGLPNFLVNQLEKKTGPLAGKKVGLLGMAFKADNDDTRESLSYKVKKILESRLAIVQDTDVYQDTHSSLDTILKTSEAFILGVPHKEYKALNLQGKPFVDCWGTWHGSIDLSRSVFETLSGRRLTRAA
jgi:UDP-N-acetyl-D-mannosaminuronic acid dehydrogenase